MDRLLHTPDGVRDIYGKECAKKNKVEELISDQLSLFGYEKIETPTFEFFDVFNRERGSVPSREMYKFFDRDNNTLVLRPDITPAIARCVAGYFGEESMPLRLCYLGNTFLNNSNLKGKMKETTQTGAELIGDDSVDADAEMIILAVKCLLAAGLTDFQVEVGQADFYKGILDDAGLSEEQDMQIRELIENKNSFGVQEFADKTIKDPAQREIFQRLPELFGTIEQIRNAKELTGNIRSRNAVERLEKISELIRCYGLTEYVTYDLGMLSKYEYYTGVIFKAYSYGTGDYLINGGRYDKLLIQFGKDKPAVGFGITIDRLLLAIQGQRITIPVAKGPSLVVYGRKNSQEALNLLRKMREEGKRTAGIVNDGKWKEEEIISFAEKNGIEEIIRLGEHGE